MVLFTPAPLTYTFFSVILDQKEDDLLKKFCCMFLALVMLALCACGSDGGALAVFEENDGVVSHAVPLYPHVSGDERTAYLLRRANSDTAGVALASRPGAEYTVIYETPSNAAVYELYADGGIIAFYELTVYSDGSVGYALKIIDTGNGSRVVSPFKKTVSENTGAQTRFIVVFDGCVYYLTESPLLGRCRVMRYRLSDGALDEYLSYPLTDNEITAGSSCTFISSAAGYLTCGVVEGSRTTLKTYELTSGDLVREKVLPYSVAMVYMADHDYMTGLYAMYYMNAQGEECVGITQISDDAGVNEVMKLSKSEYLDREEVRLLGDKVVFTVQDQDQSEDPYKAFYTVTAGAADLTTTRRDGVYEIVRIGGQYYSMSFGKKTGYSKVTLSKTELN